MDTDTGADGRWLTYAELAEVRGIGKASAERLVRRHKWRRQTDNRGNVRVLVPLDALEGEGADKGEDVSHDMSHVINVLEIALTSLGQRAEAAERRADQAEARATAAEQTAAVERGRAAQAATEATTLRGQVEMAEVATATAEANAATAEAELVRLREADQFRRSRGVLTRLRDALRGERDAADALKVTPPQSAK